MQCRLALFLSIAPVWHRVYVVKPLPIPHTGGAEGGRWGIPLIRALCRHMYLATYVYIYLRSGSNLHCESFSFWRLKRLLEESATLPVSSVHEYPISLSPSSRLLSSPIDIGQNVMWKIASA